MARGRKADDSDDPLSRQVSCLCVALELRRATSLRLTSPGSLVGVGQSLKAAVWYTVTKVSLFCYPRTQE